MALTRPIASQINFDVTNISDPLIRLNSEESGSNAKDVGLIIERGSDQNRGVIWDESSDEFAFINTTETGTTSGNVTIAAYANIQASSIAGTLTTASQPNITTVGTIGTGVWQGTAIDDAYISHTGDTSDPHSVTKAQVGLANVENTALSTHTGNTSNPHSVTKTQVGLANVENTALSTHTGNTSNPHSVTKAQVGLANVENTALSTWAGSSNITTVGTLASVTVTNNITVGGIVGTAATGVLEIPIGTTAQRPGSPATGGIRFNSTVTRFEGYNGSAWVTIDTLYN